MGFFLSKSRKELKEVVGFGIYDVVDTVDPELIQCEVGWIMAAGGNPIKMVKGETVSQMTLRIQERAIREPIRLLRIHGHGEPGVQLISSGTTFPPEQPSYAISGDEFDKIKDDLSRLIGYFTMDADVILMGCNVAKGEKGKELLQNLANLWRVPITGGIKSQTSSPYNEEFLKPKWITEYESDMKLNLETEGPTEKIYPTKGLSVEGHIKTFYPL